MQHKITAFLASKRFFLILMGFFVFEAAWIALSGRYPMAFDEDFHLGVIKLYAHHLSPFWSTQPFGSAIYGAVFRDPSYLYHYLMSFPYRFISLFTHDQTIQVLCLRFINIGLITSSLPLYRRLLLKTGASLTVTQLMLAFFVLIPIVPFLGAQINYDNLLLPLVAIFLLLVLKINRELETYKRLPTSSIGLGLIVGLLTSLVKYAFLPIFVVGVVFIAIQAYRNLGRHKKFWRSVAVEAGRIRLSSRWLLIIGLVVSFGLFTERYGLNLVRYHEIVPDCSQVLNVQRCSTYSPWLRDYTLASAKGSHLHGPVGFTGDWLYGMWLRTLFSLGGPDTSFETRGPLLLPGIATIVLVGAGVILLIWKAGAVFKRYNAPVLWLFVATSISYGGVLWFDEYRSYRHTGQPVAINGRYLLPVSLLVMILFALAYSEAFRRYRRAEAAIAATGIICFLWGGGLVTYILRSHDTWYWPNHYVLSVNQTVQHGLYHVVPGAYTTGQFLR